MTEYFEVHGRDGAARRGELRLADPLATPALVDGSVDDAGSLWAAERTVPDGYREILTVLPHRSFPAGTDETVQEAFAVEYPDVDFPSAAVVTSETAADYGADAYVLSDAPGFVGHAAAFRDELIAAREALPPDTAIYLSGVATPRNAATLVYAGVDLLDAKRARVRGLDGFYLTREDEQFLAFDGHPELLEGFAVLANGRPDLGCEFLRRRLEDGQEFEQFPQFVGVRLDRLGEFGHLAVLQRDAGVGLRICLTHGLHREGVVATHPDVPVQ